LGAVIEVHGSGAVNARETTEEERARQRAMREASKDGNNRLALAQFNEWIAGKPVEYLGEETVQVRGTAGPVPESGTSSGAMG
jgi:hypothetical protein